MAVSMGGVVSLTKSNLANPFAVLPEGCSVLNAHLYRKYNDFVEN